MENTNPIRNGQIVSSLRIAIHNGKHSLDNVPGLVVRVVDENCWREHIVEKTGERVVFRDFTEFVNTAPLEGLGTSLEQLKRVCGGSPVALDAIDRASRNPEGGNNNPDGRKGKNKEITTYNVSSDLSSKRTNIGGNARSAALRRLRDQRPDLHALVLKSDMTANEAMVIAGFRRKVITLSYNVPTLVATLRANFTQDELTALIDALTHENTPR